MAVTLLLVFLSLGAVSPSRADAACVAQPPEFATGPPPRAVCIADKPFRARGWFNPRCLDNRAVPGERYPNANWCQGGNVERIEAIAHSRFITSLGYDPRGIDPDVQWEIQLAGRTRRADVTHDTGASEVDLYEVKQTSNGGYLQTIAQLDIYTQLFTGAGVPTKFGTHLYEDWFLVGTGTTCATPSGQTVAGNRLFISFLVAPGVIAVSEAPFRCFDAPREPVPVPAPYTVPVPVRQGQPGTANVPVGVVGNGLSRPAPGTAFHTVVTPPLPTPAPVTPPPNPGSGSTGAAGGDPHMTSLDGLGFDLQAAGEFQLVEADGVNIQVRLGKRGSSVSVVDRIAFELGDHAAEIEPLTMALRVDGKPITLGNGYMLDFGDGANIMRYSGCYYVTWPGEGVRPLLRTCGGFISYYVPPDLHPRGLLGDADGDPRNDLMLSDGTRLVETASPATIHSTFADSWRISDDDTLFTYAPGESTATFTDQAFPDGFVSLSDFPDDVLAEATAQCQAAGVADGRAFENCLLDWAVTREQAFVDAAADDDVPSIEAGARRVDASGVVTENFESSVAPNFSSPRYGSGAGSGRFAGPFGRDGRYSASVSLLPGHETATVQLDVVTLGSWPTDASSPVTIAIDGRTAWTGDLVSRTPSSQGTTPAGLSYAIYPLSVHVEHSAEQLAIGVSAHLPVGASRAFAVDNVRASLELVAPDTFNVSLPFQAPRTSLPGAGNLETTGSEDRYRFAASSAAAVQVDLSDCATPARWTLSRVSDGQSVAEGECGSKRTPALTAGDYELSVMSRGRTGTYRLAVATVPDPQRFGVSLPVAAGNDFPAQGAGRLEATASQDDYEFSTQVTGGVVIDFGGCSDGLTSVAWRLVDATSGIVQASGNSCSSHLVPNLKAGSFRLEVTSNGRTGSYVVSLASQPSPQIFAVDLPATIQDGSPAGAGSLETTASEDVYAFQTSSPGGLVVDLSNCATSLRNVDWKLNTEAGATIKSGSEACGGNLIADLPAGGYRLAITHKGATGTYKLRLQSQPSPQEFNVTLAATIQDGSPAGAGNLETSGSEDVYAFSISATGGLQVDLSNCSYGGVAWKLTDAGGATIQTSGSGYGSCTSESVPSLPAGSYKLSIKHPAGLGDPRTYRLGLLATPSPQTFQVTPPATISNGSPTTGAGNLETTASEDRYQFTTTATSTVRLEFSQCTGSLSTSYAGGWSLVRISDGNTVASSGWYCDSTDVRDVPAGTYQLRVANNGAQGTYRLRLLAQPPQAFNVSLPASISDGSPQAGAGSLETSASTDVYVFSTTTAGGLEIDTSNCSSTLTDVAWELIDSSGNQVAYDRYYGGTCSGTLVPDLPSGSYTLRVASPAGRTGTYAMAVFAQPTPQTFQVTAPASISDATPSAGAGNLETTASEDRYEFTTTAKGIVHVSFSDCAQALNSNAGSWKLVRSATGDIVNSGSWNCSWPTEGRAEDVPAGTYQLRIAHAGAKGTYKLRLYAEQAHTFDVALPASISDGTPTPGAGNLENPASEDDYAFQTTASGDLLVDLADCASSASAAGWKLLSETGAGAVKASGSSCSGKTVTGLAAGRYRVTVSGGTGTYHLAIVSPPSPDTFPVTLPASISDGSPAAGAGKLETSVSEDRYEFTTTATGNLELGFADCASSLHYLNFKLIRTSTGAQAASGLTGCGDQRISNLPAGSYQLRITAEDGKGSYKLALTAAAPQRFALTLPASVADGSPAAGAGNLESTASDDIYTFDTQATGGLEINASNCSSGLGDLNWRLLDEDGTVRWISTGTCTEELVPNLPPGRYTLSISRPGRTGTYQVAIVSEAPQTFDVALPAAISDGSPSAGAGNIETTASQDRYKFTTAANGRLQFTFSQCSSSLNAIKWRLYDHNGDLVTYSSSAACVTWWIDDRAASDYTLEVSGDGRTGTYQLQILSAAPQNFDVTAPASISDGSPSPGAGNLETIASEDRYRFTTTSTGKIRFAFSECSSSLGYVSWKLVNENGYTISKPSTGACAVWTLSNVDAGTYTLRVYNGFASGTYKLQLLAESPQQFDVALPANISNGSPATGAGNLESGISEDVYTFDMNSTDRLKLAFSECSATTKVNWKLTTVEGSPVTSREADCGSTIVTDVVAGRYKLKVTGGAGTYKLQMLVPIAPQTFNVTLPVSISNGSPSAGAGNLETADSEDRYRFTTTSTTSVQMAFTECAGLPALTTVTWTLVNAQTRTRLAGADASACNTTTMPGLAAGTYEVRVSKVAPINSALSSVAKPTYKLGLQATAAT